MFPGDSHRRGHGAVAGRSLALATLAFVFWAGGEALTGIETGLYDFLQRTTAGTPEARVTLVTIDASGPGSLWSSRQLPEVFAAARRAGALAVVPAEVPGSVVQPGEVERVAELLELETRTNAGDRERLERLQGQLGELQTRSLRQQASTAAVLAAGNVLVSPRTLPGNADVAGLAPACGARLNHALEDHAGDQRGRAAGLAPGLCEGAAALAHLGFQADRDGILRSLPEPVLLPEGLLPPVHAAAAGLVVPGGGEEPAPARMAGRADRPLLRFYSGGALAPAFQTLTAPDLLAGRGLDSIREHVVVVGRKAGAESMPTPLSDSAPWPTVVATSIANRIEGSFLVRPGWGPWSEGLLALLLGMALGVGGSVLPYARAAGLAVGSAVVLGAGSVVLFLAGIWLHLAALAAFALAACALLPLLARWRPSAATKASQAAPTRDLGLGGPVAELDLAFSVLRQQPTTDDTKSRLYDLAMEHGRRRDYARAERVFRHLAARDPGYRDVASKLERLSGARLAAQPPEPRPSIPPPQADAGRSLGRYSLERVLGRGAMATVYMGRDPTINRRVAIKTVPLAEEFEESDLANAKAHFRREAESSGRLNHPNIISIYDAGEDGNVAYLAMEYFEGQPLSHFTQMDQLLPPRLVLCLMARAAEALHYAHSQNVVHRDVKPANILYHRGSDALKLTDFGIARLTDANRTRTGIILGTPSYMSPEQLTASKVTGQSDLYSLGVTMYHLLTGSPPFQADSIPKLMQKIATEKHRPVRDFRDDVPPCVDAILDRAMAKAPEDRYPDGRSMAMALRACSDSVPADFP